MNNMNRRITKEIKSRVIQMYQSGFYTNKQISEECGNICHRSINKIVIDNGLKLKTKPTRKTTEEQKRSMIEMYTIQKYKCREIDRILGLSLGVTCNNLRKMGIEIDNDPSSVHRIYTLDENYFDEIDTEGKGYFLGFLTADCYNNQKMGTFHIGIQEKDFNILEKLKIELKCNKPLYLRIIDNPNHQNEIRLSLNSRRISDKLSEYGCIQKKSLTLHFPSSNLIPKHIMRHYLRGFWDGNGGFCFSRGKNKFVDLTFTSTMRFCEGIQNELDKIGIGRKQLIIPNKGRNINIRRLTISKISDIFQIYDWFYTGATFYLDRKFRKINNFINIYKTQNGGVF